MVSRQHLAVANEALPQDSVIHILDGAVIPQCLRGSSRGNLAKGEEDRFHAYRAERDVRSRQAHRLSHFFKMRTGVSPREWSAGHMN